MQLHLDLMHETLRTFLFMYMPSPCLSHFVTNTKFLTSILNDNYELNHINSSFPLCGKQELRVLLVITTTGSEAGHVLHQAFKKIRISLLQFCKGFEAEVGWQSLNRNCECHSLAIAEFPF
jgi:hypothetical protein